MSNRRKRPLNKNIKHQEPSPKRIKLANEENDKNTQKNEGKKQLTISDVQEFMENFMLIRPSSWNDYDSTLRILSNLVSILTCGNNGIQFLIDKRWVCQTSSGFSLIQSSFQRNLFRKFCDNKITEKTFELWYNALDLLTNEKTKFNLLSQHLLSCSFVPLNYLSITEYDTEMLHHKDKDYFVWHSEQSNKIKMMLIQNLYDYKRQYFGITKNIEDRPLFSINISPMNYHKYYIFGNAFTNRERVKIKGISHVFIQFTPFAMQRLIEFNVYIPFMQMTEDWFCDDENGDRNDYDYYGDDFIENDALFTNDLITDSMKQLIDEAHYKHDYILALIYLCKKHHFEYKSQMKKAIKNVSINCTYFPLNVISSLMEYMFQDLSYLQFETNYENKWKKQAKLSIKHYGTKQWKDWCKVHLL